MVTVQVTVKGLAILCVNNERGLISLLRYDEHNLNIMMEPLGDSDKAPVEKWVDINPPGTPLDTGVQNIAFSVTGPEIEGTRSDQTPIVRTEGPNSGNAQSLRWILDLEGPELHDGTVNHAGKKSGDLRGRTNITIPNAYFYTADIRRNQEYLIKKPSGQVERFGRIGHVIGALIYGDTVTIAVDGLTPLTLGGNPNQNDFYKIEITNLEDDNRRMSDFGRYYDAIQPVVDVRYKFLLADGLLPFDPGSTPIDPGKGPSFECFCTQCGSTGPHTHS
jgi:hypothetical protein